MNKKLIALFHRKKENRTRLSSTSWTRNSVLILRELSCSESERWDKSESISSMNITDGWLTLNKSISKSLIDWFLLNVIIIIIKTEWVIPGYGEKCTNHFLPLTNPFRRQRRCADAEKRRLGLTCDTLAYIQLELISEIRIEMKK